MSCFFFDFGVALGAPWDGLTCNPHTPVQSKHTFSFLHVFSKIGSTWPHSDSILEQFFVNNHNFEWKKSSKKWFKKRWPPCRKQQAMNTAGGSRRQAHYQELFEQETIVRTHVEAIVRVFAWKCKLGWKLNSKSKIVPYKFHEIFKFQVLFKSHDLTRPGQRPGEF